MTGVSRRPGRLWTSSAREVRGAYVCRGGGDRRRDGSRDDHGRQGDAEASRAVRKLRPIHDGAVETGRVAIHRSLQGRDMVSTRASDSIAHGRAITAANSARVNSGRSPGVAASVQVRVHHPGTDARRSPRVLPAPAPLHAHPSLPGWCAAIACHVGLSTDELEWHRPGRRASAWSPQDSSARAPAPDQCGRAARRRRRRACRRKQGGRRGGQRGVRA